jgi:integrase
MTGRGRLVADLRTDDFTAIRSALAKRLGPVALGNQIQRIRSVFKFALDMGLIKSPMIFGAGFKSPTKKVLRLERKKRGPKLFEREDIHKLLTTAGPCMRAMILLGINCGFGNADVGQLPIDALDLKTGWVNYHRSKTGIDRRCHLWPETVAALEKAIAIRTEPSDPEHANLVFLTKRRLPWFKPTKSNPLCHEFQKLVQLAGLKPGRGFYCFRHGFETIGGASRDQVAVNAVMGHADESMAANYRERIEDDRLIAVSNHVHSWLYGKPAG